MSDEPGFDEGIVDALEHEVEEYKAFLFKRGLLDHFDAWLESADYEEDIEAYQKQAEQDSDNIESELL